MNPNIKLRVNQSTDNFADGSPRRHHIRLHIRFNNESEANSVPTGAGKFLGTLLDAEENQRHFGGSQAQFVHPDPTTRELGFTLRHNSVTKAIINELQTYAGTLTPDNFDGYRQLHLLNLIEAGFPFHD